MKIEVSNGELIDKWTILYNKIQHVDDAAKINVEKELDLLDPLVQELDVKFGLSADIMELYFINKKLWDIEDKIREKHARNEFDGEFIDLAKSVYITNDKRAKLKRRINDLTNSTLVEEKAYVNYEKSDH